MCDCKDNKECDNSLCIQTPNGPKCAQNCIEDCPDASFKCALVSAAGGDAVTICVPRWGQLCNPCTESKECIAVGLKNPACVEFGAAGAFCSVQCDEDADCPAGHGCKTAFSVEGGKSKQCIPTADEGDGYGECTCSDSAKAKKLSTPCWIEAKDEDGKVVGKCPGVRKCTNDGLTACQAPPAEVEKCDGEDNDCDGQTDEDTCNDDNPCTQDGCDPKLTIGGGDGCTHDNLDAPCDADKSLCTEGDKCIEGACKAGKQKNCDDGNPCTKDVCDPIKGCSQSKDDGVPCSDDNPCTISDLCSDGECVPGKPKKCASGDTCILAKCNIETGKCSFKNMPDGVPCTDGTACTKSDSCLSGTCLGKVVDCDDNNPCTNDGCDSQSGCANKPNSAPCNDGNLCTDADSCADGACKGKAKDPAVDCDDGNACTKESCSAKKGCVNTITNDKCDDGNKCTNGDACKDGKCAGGENVCQCESYADCKPFEDGDACNGTLMCDQSEVPFKCKVNPKSVVKCSKESETTCLKNTCDKTNGICKLVAIAEGKTCDADNSICTVGDVCKGGVCQAGALKKCNDDNACTTDSCDPAKGCLHAPASGACNDGNACTTADTCTEGVCKGKGKIPDKDCDDANGCTKEGCDPKTGCTHTPAAGACNDGDPCTTGDACSNGACKGGGNICQCNKDKDCTSFEDGDLCNGTLFCDKTGLPFKCNVAPQTVVKCSDKGNTACLANQCDKSKGSCKLVPVNQGKNCDADSSVCTIGDACASGFCQAGKLKNCDDNNACTDDTCDAKLGCANKPNSAPCQDGDQCTLSDKCVGGQCTKGVAKSCDDQEPCTSDACDKKSGKCINNPIPGCGGFCLANSDCNDNNPCTTNNCINSKCLLTNNSKPCDDGNKCSNKDTCTKGKCVGQQVDCDDGNPCTIDACKPAVGCINTPTSLPCEDGSKCTLGDQCKDAKCKSGVQKVCADNDKCTTDSCDPKSGSCVSSPIFGCGGNCKDKAHCDDSNACTDDVCVAKTGKCTNPNNSAKCNDGDKCTANDTCSFGKCKGGEAIEVLTLAGTGKTGMKNGAGNGATFSTPIDVAVDQQGNVYVADMGNHVIRAYAPSGAVSTLAGAGQKGYKDGFGGGAFFYNPSGVATAATGLVYVADRSNGRIRSITSQGLVLSLAGSGSAGFKDGKGAAAQFNQPWDVAASPEGVLYVADYNNNRVRKVLPNGLVTTLAGSGSGKSVDGKGGQASFHQPRSMAVAPDGMVFVAEWGSSHRIRRVTPGGIVTTIAGGGSGMFDGPAGQSRFANPAGLAFDSAGNLFVADHGNHRVRRLTGGFVSTLAGFGQSGFQDGTAEKARFHHPQGVGADVYGRVYVADTSNHRVRKINDTSKNCSLGGACYTNGAINPASPCQVCDSLKNPKGWTKVPAGAPCNDGKLCTAKDACDAKGVCAGKGSSCDDGNSCTKDACDPKTGLCLHSKIVGCKGYCELDGHCDDSNVCTDDACVKNVCQYGFNNKTCKSGNPCSAGDSCFQGSCVAKQVVTVTTLAGSGYGYKDGSAAQAKFYYPWGVDVAANGHVYIADYNNNRIRKLENNGLVKTFAGSGSKGYLDGAASQARFNRPLDVGLDAAGNVYVMDYYNDRVRKVTPKGIVSTLAGSSTGYANGTGSNAKFYRPRGLAVTPAGAVFVADTHNNLIRRVTPSGVVTTVAGSTKWGTSDGKGSSARFRHPAGIAVDGHGIIWVADTDNHRIRRISQDGTVVTVAGSSAGLADGAAKQAKMYGPTSIDVDGAGRVFVADSNNHRIRRLFGGIISTVAGTTNGYANGTGAQAKFNNPQGVAVDNKGALFVGDFSNHRLRKVVDATGSCNIDKSCWAAGLPNPKQPCQHCDAFSSSTKWTPTKAGKACDDGKLCTTADTCDAKGVCAAKPTTCDDNNKCTKDSCEAATGQCLFAKIISAACYCNSSKDCDDKNPCTSNACTSGKCVQTFNNNKCNSSDPCSAGDLCSFGKCVPVHSTMVYYVAGNGYGFKDGAAKVAYFRNPWSIVRGPKGNIFIADRDNHRIRRMAPDGTVITWAGNGGYGFVDGISSAAKFRSPHDVAVDNKGIVYVADTNNRRVRKVTTNGLVSTLAGNGSQGATNGPGVSATFGSIQGIVATPGGGVYVSDAQYHRIRYVDPKGYVKNFVGMHAGHVNAKGTSARFNNPRGMDLDRDGNLYVADLGNRRIRKVTANGVVTTIAGSGASGFADGKAMSAKLSNPFDVVVAPDGTVYFTGDSNHRVRKVANGVVSTVAGSTYGYVNGVGTEARFAGPHSLLMGPQGRIWVADTSNHKIRKIWISKDNCYVDKKCWLNGSRDPANVCQSCDANKAAKAWSKLAKGTSCEDGDLCKSSTCDDKGQCVGKAKNCDDGDKCTADACQPTGLCKSTPIMGCGGNCSQTSHCDDKNPCTDDKCSNGKCGWGFNSKPCQTADPCSKGDTCAVGKCQAGFGTWVTWFSLNGSYYSKDGLAHQAALGEARGLKLKADGTMIVVDRSKNRVVKMSATGAVTTLAGGNYGFKDGFGTQAQFAAPDDIALAGDGSILVSDTNNHRIRKIATSSAVTTVTMGGGGYQNGHVSVAKLNSPHGLVLSKGGTLYIADWGNSRIRTLKGSTVSTLAGGAKGYANGQGGSARFNGPAALTLDRDGNLLVSDYYNHRIRKVTPNGLVTTLAGGNKGYGEGKALVAKFNYPYGIAHDTAGNLYIADRSNMRVRKLSPGGIVSTFAGSQQGYFNGTGSTARFNAPHQLVVLPDGTVVVSENGNRRFRKIKDPQNNCKIDKVCYSAGITSAKAPCHHCLASASKTAWTTKTKGMACDDGKYCATGDACDGAKTCAGKTKSCNDNNKCTTDSCDTGTGRCLHKPIAGC